VVPGGRRGKARECSEAQRIAGRMNLSAFAPWGRVVLSTLAAVRPSGTARSSAGYIALEVVVPALDLGVFYRTAHAGGDGDAGRGGPAAGGGRAGG